MRKRPLIGGSLHDGLLNMGKIGHHYEETSSDRRVPT